MVLPEDGYPVVDHGGCLLGQSVSFHAAVDQVDGLGCCDGAQVHWLGEGIVLDYIKGLVRVQG